MLPAVGQGAVGCEIRADDTHLQRRLAAIDHAPTRLATAAERAMLARLEGNCRTPIAGHARLADGLLSLTGLVAQPDGRRAWRLSLSAPADEGEALGREVGLGILEMAGDDFPRVA